MPDGCYAGGDSASKAAYEFSGDTKVCNVVCDLQLTQFSLQETDSDAAELLQWARNNEYTWYKAGQYGAVGASSQGLVGGSAHLSGSSVSGGSPHRQPSWTSLRLLMKSVRPTPNPNPNPNPNGSLESYRGEVIVRGIENGQGGRRERG